MSKKESPTWLKGFKEAEKEKRVQIRADRLTETAQWEKEQKERSKLFLPIEHSTILLLKKWGQLEIDQMIKDLKESGVADGKKITPLRIFIEAEGKKTKIKEEKIEYQPDGLFRFFERYSVDKETKTSVFGDRYTETEEKTNYDSNKSLSFLLAEMYSFEYIKTEKYQYKLHINKKVESSWYIRGFDGEDGEWNVEIPFSIDLSPELIIVNNEVSFPTNEIQTSEELRKRVDKYFADKVKTGEIKVWEEDEEEENQEEDSETEEENDDEEKKEVFSKVERENCIYCGIALPLKYTATCGNCGGPRPVVK